MTANHLISGFPCHSFSDMLTDTGGTSNFVILNDKSIVLAVIWISASYISITFRLQWLSLFHRTYVKYDNILCYSSLGGGAAKSLYLKASSDLTDLAEQQRRSARLRAKQWKSTTGRDTSGTSSELTSSSSNSVSVKNKHILPQRSDAKAAISPHARPLCSWVRQCLHAHLDFRSPLTDWLLSVIQICLDSKVRPGVCCVSMWINLVSNTQP